MAECNHRWEAVHDGKYVACAYCIEIRRSTEINAAGQEPSGKSPATGGNVGHEQKDSRGSAVRDVPVPAAPLTPWTNRVQDKHALQWFGIRAPIDRAMDEANKMREHARSLERLVHQQQRKLQEADCSCSIPERMSGHLIGCWKSDLDEIDAAYATLKKEIEHG